jgi:hypothetical protein
MNEKEECRPTRNYSSSGRGVAVGVTVLNIATVPLTAHNRYCFTKHPPIFDVDMIRAFNSDYSLQ